MPVIGDCRQLVHCKSRVSLILEDRVCYKGREEAHHRSYQLEHHCIKRLGVGRQIAAGTARGTWRIIARLWRHWGRYAAL